MKVEKRPIKGFMIMIMITMVLKILLTIELIIILMIGLIRTFNDKVYNINKDNTYNNTK